MRITLPMTTVRGGARRAGLALLALSLLSAPTVPGAAAQEARALSSVHRLQDLHFGTLVPGTENAVSVQDVSRRAEVVLHGRGAVQLLIVLPSEMVSPEGARLPLRFGPADAAFVAGTAAQPQRFDPRAGAVVTLPPAGEARLLLGGTAVVPFDQPAGQYSADLLVMVVNTRS